MYRCIPSSVVVVLLIGSLSLRASAGLVDVEWRPSSQSADVGGIVDIQLYIFAPFSVETVAGVEAVVVWDPTSLELLGITDPCRVDPCAPGTYNWLDSKFPDDSRLDGLNDTFEDGDAFYQAFGQLGAGGAAVVTVDGLHVTTFHFRVLRAGPTQVELLPTFGNFSKTRVFDGVTPGADITGTIGPSATVDASGCAPAVTFTATMRYLTVTPGGTVTPIALKLFGDEGDPDVTCVSSFVQDDGSIGDTPFFQSGLEWGTVFVAGMNIVPGETYGLTIDCDPVSGPLLSESRTATTSEWGDSNGNGEVTFDDVSLVINASNGVFGEGITLQQADIAPCEPDGVVDELDVNAVFDAFGGFPYPCPGACDAALDLEFFTQFVPCLEGPDTAVPGACVQFDFDFDQDVDLNDLRHLQENFVGQ